MNVRMSLPKTGLHLFNQKYRGPLLLLPSNPNWLSCRTGRVDINSFIFRFNASTVCLLISLHANPLPGPSFNSNHGQYKGRTSRNISKICVGIHPGVKLRISRNSSSKGFTLSCITNSPSIFRSTHPAGRPTQLFAIEPGNCANVIELTISKCTTSIHCPRKDLHSTWAAVPSLWTIDLRLTAQLIWRRVLYWPFVSCLVGIRIRFRRLRPLMNYCQINKFALVCLAKI